jgi:hypothetical protein
VAEKRAVWWWPGEDLQPWILLIFLLIQRDLRGQGSESALPLASWEGLASYLVSSVFCSVNRGHNPCLMGHCGESVEVPSCLSFS